MKSQIRLGRNTASHGYNYIITQIGKISKRLKNGAFFSYPSKGPSFKKTYGIMYFSDTYLKERRAFTIVELLIVIVVIAILAAITIVAYNGITAQAEDSAIKTDLSTAAKQLHITKIEEGSFPETGPDDTSLSSFSYEQTSTGFCLEATGNDRVFYITESTPPKEGGCPLVPIAMQTINNINCTTKRMLGYDARDNRTYWIQKMPDNKCWMLTNLAYAGGGDNSYGDAKVIADGTGESNSYTTPKYYTPPGASLTVRPAHPSTSTNGSGQYGLLYNWCAAMGAQLSTNTCSTSNSVTHDTGASICPNGWRLPTATMYVGEFQQLVNAVGAGNNKEGTEVLMTSWLAQMGGIQNGPFNQQGEGGYYWSSTQINGTSAASLNLYAEDDTYYGVYPDVLQTKSFGSSIRCIAI